MDLESLDDAADLAALQLALRSAKPDPWLTPEEAADMVGRSPHTLGAWRQRGIGPAYFRTGPSGVRYRQSAVNAWLAMQPT